MRRGIGVQRKNLDVQRRRAFQDKGKELTEDNLAYVSEQMDKFKEHLEQFARKRKGQINKDPYFRYQFQKMCAKLGVDPLSSNKGFWAQLLGVGNFYTELGIQIIHICLATRESNGGLMRLTQLCDRLQRARGRSERSDIIEGDVEYAIKPLGNAIHVITTQSGDKMVISVPFELSSDHLAILDVAKSNAGCVHVAGLQQELQWTEERINRSFQILLRQGLIWVDKGGGSVCYWFPSLFGARTSVLGAGATSEAQARN